MKKSYEFDYLGAPPYDALFIFKVTITDAFSGDFTTLQVAKSEAAIKAACSGCMYSDVTEIERLGIYVGNTPNIN